MKDRTSRRHPNQAEKQALAATELTLVVMAAGRKSSGRNGFDPTDRDYRGMSKKLRGISPENVDSLIRDDEV